MIGIRGSARYNDRRKSTPVLIDGHPSPQVDPLHHEDEDSPAEKPAVRASPMPRVA